MYLLQTLSVDWERNKAIVQHGIYAGALEREPTVIVKDEFWGKTEIVLKSNSDFGFTPEKKGKYTLLSYVNNFKVEDLSDGFKKLHFYVGKRDDRKFEGYMIFIKSCSTDIETNGEKLFYRTPNSIVVILKDGQYVKFEGLEFENYKNRFVQVLAKFT